jgi:hypothetical protein
LNLAASAYECLRIERTVEVARLVGEVQHALQEDLTTGVGACEVVKNDFVIAEVGKLLLDKLAPRRLRVLLLIVTGDRVYISELQVAADRRLGLLVRGRWGGQ